LKNYSLGVKQQSIKSGKTSNMGQTISEEPTKSFGIKTEYMPRAVVRLVNIFNCIEYDWTVSDE
jgi:hypothetical protein